jgi:cytochrome P450
VFPAERDNRYAPPAAYRSGPADGGPFEVDLAYGGKAWLITRHADVRALLSDSRISSNASVEGYPMVPLSHREQRPGVFLSMDPPEHEYFRGLLTREFSAGAVAARRPLITRHVDRLIDRMTAQGRSADLVTAFADRLPCHVIGELFGADGKDETFVERCLRARATHDKSLARRLSAGEQMRRFLGDLVAEKRENPTDDLISRLAAAITAGKVTEEEAVGMATLVLAASLDATSALTTLTVLSILQDEARTALVRADPARWAKPAVEESLRFWTVIQHGPLRTATADIEIGDRLIREGDRVVLQLHSANWDSAVFPRPDVFDLDRETQPHLAFGYGAHRCLGGGLGQLEATVAVEGLFTRLPGLTLEASADELVYRDEDLVYNVRALPLSW